MESWRRISARRASQKCRRRGECGVGHFTYEYWGTYKHCLLGVSEKYGPKGPMEMARGETSIACASNIEYKKMDGTHVETEMKPGWTFQLACSKHQETRFCVFIWWQMVCSVLETPHVQNRERHAGGLICLSRPELDLSENNPDLSISLDNNMNRT